MLRKLLPGRQAGSPRGRHRVASSFRPTQCDPGAANKMLETLRFGQVEIDVARAPFTAGGRQYPAGTLRHPDAAAVSAFAKTLLERQKYPDLRLYPGGPPKRPYDVTAQTLPLLMGVDIADHRIRVQRRTHPARGYSFRLRSPTGKHGMGSLQRGFLEEREQRAGRRESGFSGCSPATLYPAPGTATDSGETPSHRTVPKLDAGYGRRLDAVATGTVRVRLHEPYEREIQRGSLRERFDTIVFPDQSVRASWRGTARGLMPPEYTGGIGGPGIAAL